MTKRNTKVTSIRMSSALHRAVRSYAERNRKSINSALIDLVQLGFAPALKIEEQTNKLVKRG